MQWAHHSPDLNPTENLWFELEREVHMHKLFCMEEWPKIPLQVFSTLLDITKRDSVLLFSSEQASKYH